MTSRSIEGKRAPGKTAWQIEQERRGDPEWIAMRVEQDTKLQESLAKMHAEQELLVTEICVQP